MPKELTARDVKLIQYLNEAYGKEKQLETALQAHIAMTSRPPYKKRLQEHLRETKAQAKGLERRIRQLGGKAEAIDLPGPDATSALAAKVAAAASKAIAAAKGPVHALRGTGEAEKMLKNAKTELSEEHEEIGNYLAIETLAEAVGDADTAKLARDHRRQEERMAAFLTRLIPQLAKAVATEEIPRAERAPAARPRRRTASRASGATGATRTRSRAASG
jgi:ferritin-like metal-binding protein YciE